MSSDRSTLPRSVTVVLVAGAVMSCATPTPYQPDTGSQPIAGGYSDEQIGDNRYRVTFAGNCYTSRDRVEGYLMYRAAELTLEKEHDWFLILDRMTERDARTYVHPDPAYRPYYGSGYSYWRPWWRYYVDGYGWRIWYPVDGDPYWGDRSRSFTVEKFEAHAEIDLHSGPIPAGEDRAFDARQVIADLEPSIERPLSAGGMC